MKQNMGIRKVIKGINDNAKMAQLIDINLKRLSLILKNKEIRITLEICLRDTLWIMKKKGIF